ncbi:MAG: sigma-70 family RNA polymerase sigma factor [Bacteroidales bacterium]|nr:sigma-70 family RNA polymerase sigma factor [Bacteroidales bacterium]
MRGAGWRLTTCCRTSRWLCGSSATGWRPYRRGVQQAAWVWRVARNAAIDTLRRTPQTEALPEGMEQAADDTTLVEHLRERIALLPEQDRKVVEMQLEGYSYDEIAAATGLTVKNVSVKLVRIKDKIRKEWL